MRNSLLESFRSRRFSLVAGLDAIVTNWTDPLTLNPRLWRASRLNHNGRCSASFAQVSALMSQNAVLEAQLVSQQNIAQGLAELLGAITTVLSRSHAPMRRMLVDPKGSGRPPVFSGREEHFFVWTKKVENHVSGVFPNVRGALTFAAESRDVATPATVAIGMPELGVETSAERDGQLFVALSARTEGESFDTCHVSRRWRWLRELPQAARKMEPVHSGTSTKSLEGDSVADANLIA